MTYERPTRPNGRSGGNHIETGEMEYLGKTYLGVSAFCRTRHDTRMFRVDRILEMKTAE